MNKEIENLVIKMRDLGYSYGEIARILRVSKSGAYKVYKKSLKSRWLVFKYVFLTPGRIITNKFWKPDKGGFRQNLCEECRTIFDVEDKYTCVLCYSLFFYLFVIMMVIRLVTI